MQNNKRTLQIKTVKIVLNVGYINKQMKKKQQIETLGKYQSTLNKQAAIPNRDAPIRYSGSESRSIRDFSAGSGIGLTGSIQIRFSALPAEVAFKLKK